MESCAHCRFFKDLEVVDEDKEGYGFGLCRRRAPVTGAWPWVEDSDWCGEWARIGPAPLPPGVPRGHIPSRDPDLFL